MPIAYPTATTILKNSIINNHFLALSTTAPNIKDTGSGYNVTEPSTSNTTYRRINLGLASNYSDTFNPATSETKVTNDVALYFPECIIAGDKVAWGTLTHFAIYETATSIVPLYVGALTSSITPADAQIPTIRIGALELSLLPEAE